MQRFILALGMLALFSLSGARAADSPQAEIARSVHKIVGLAAQQFRGVDTFQIDNVAPFPYCSIWGWRGDGKFLVNCEETDAFHSAAAFVAASRAALPADFADITCPTDALIIDHSYLACLRGASGVEIDLVDVKNCCHEADTYTTYVVAPVPAIDRSARQTELSRLLLGIAGPAAQNFRGVTAFSVANYPAFEACGFEKYRSGRNVIECRGQNGAFADPSDFVAAIRAALPEGFASSGCAQVTDAESCLRGPRGVEVGIASQEWPLRIYAYDASYVDVRIAPVQRFLATALAASEHAFAGYSYKRYAPFNADCQTGTIAGRSLLTCSISGYEHAFLGDTDFDQVVRGALPGGYATTPCSAFKSLESEEVSLDACYRGSSGREIGSGTNDVGEDLIFVLGPAHRR